MQIHFLTLLLPFSDMQSQLIWRRAGAFTGETNLQSKWIAQLTLMLWGDSTGQPQGLITAAVWDRAWLCGAQGRECPWWMNSQVQLQNPSLWAEKGYVQECQRPLGQGAWQGAVWSSTWSKTCCSQQDGFHWLWVLTSMMNSEHRNSCRAWGVISEEGFPSCSQHHVCMTGNTRAFQAPLWPSPNIQSLLPKRFTPVTQLTQLSPMTGKKTCSVMRNHYKLQALWVWDKWSPWMLPGWTLCLCSVW